MNHVRLTSTFIVKGAIKVIAAGVEASGQLDEVASPRVAGSGETGEGHQLLSTRGEEVTVHAAIIYKTQKLHDNDAKCGVTLSCDPAQSTK